MESGSGIAGSVDALELEPSRAARGPGFRDWLLVCIAIAYVLYCREAYASWRLFTSMGVDYRAWWSAGELVRRGDFARVYDLTALGSQQNLLDVYSRGGKPFEVLPVVYQPFYIQFLVVLAWLPPVVGCMIWTCGQGFAVAAYLAFFLRRRSVLVEKRRLFLAAMLSLPIFLDLYFAQVSGLLIIPVAEMFYCLARGQTARAGLWLSLWTLKTQCLLSLIPCLLLTGHWRLLGWALVGREGFADWVYLLGHYRSEYGNWPFGMTNWRMAGLTLDHPAVTWVGMTLTFLATLWMWRRSQQIPTEWLALGTVPATLLFTWHAQPHMTCILIPVLWMAVEIGLPEWVLWSWYLLPACALAFELVVLPLGFRVDLADAWARFGALHAHLLFSFELCLLLWSLWGCRLQESTGKSKGENQV